MSTAGSYTVFIVAAALALFGQLMVLRDALAGRTPAADRSASGRSKEVLWIVLPALALVATLWGGWTLLPRHTPASPDLSRPTSFSPGR